MAKFEKKEKSIATAENTLIAEGKYVSADYEENHALHIEIHEKGGDSMMMKRHIEAHANMMKDKVIEKLRSMETEAKMVYGG